MADRSQAELRDIVEDVRRPFQALYARARGYDEVVRGTIAEWIAQNLPDELNPKVPVVDLALEHALRTVKSALRKPYEVYVEPWSSVKRDETKADHLEDICANWLLRLDENGWLLDDHNEALCVHPYSAIALTYDEFVLPHQGANLSEEQLRENQRYKEDWFGWHASVLPYDVVAFLERGRQVTLAVKHYRLPVVEIVRRYGDYKPEDAGDPELAVRLYNEQFPWLRAGEPDSVYKPSNPMWNMQFEVMEVDDGSRVCHYVKTTALGPRGGGYGSMRPGDEYMTAKDVPNYLGRPGLFVACGAYHANAPLEYRYMPLLAPLMAVEKNLDSILSLWASKALSIPRWVAPLPPEVAVVKARAIADGVKTQPVPDTTQTRPGEITNTLGKPEALVNPLDPTVVQLYEQLNQRKLAYTPISEPTPEEVTAGTAAAILYRGEQQERSIEEPVKATAAVLRDMLDAMITFHKKALNGHRKPGDARSAADVGLYATLRGSERPGHGPVERGARRELQPQDLDFGFSLKVFAVNESRAAQAAAEAQALQGYAAGFRLYDEVLAARNVTNKSEWKKQKAKEELFKLDAPGIINEARARRAAFIAARHGVSPEQVLAAVGLGAAAGGDGVTQPGQVSGQGHFEQAPALQEAGGSAAGLGAPSVQR